MDIISLFAGAGGLDLGFKKAGFHVVWANEYDKDIWETYEKNHSETHLDRRSIIKIPSSEIPGCIGIIGGPPCQSWSEAGALRGINDNRGQLFFDFIRILNDKQPLFFMAENVAGLLFKRHSQALKNILALFEEAGYIVSVNLLNAKNYEVPQDRKKVVIVGYHKNHFKTAFKPPAPNINMPTLKDAIFGLQGSAIKSVGKNNTNGPKCLVPNHEYFVDGFSSMYLSRNRVRPWGQPSFTIQASGRHAPLHPQAPKMQTAGKNKKQFVPGKEDLYRRLTVRECARIQTFPDSFTFHYSKLASGYKMVGNAVPVKLAEALAKKIKTDLNGIS